MVHATRLAMRHEPICLITSKSFITGVVATPRSEARVPQQFTRHGSRPSPKPSWRPERYRLVPENPMEGQPSDAAAFYSLGGISDTPIFIFYRNAEAITRFAQ